MNKNQNYDEVVKFILLGDSNVGKTSIMNCYCYGQLINKNPPSTIGLQYAQKVTTLYERKVLIQIWDTAGQEKFKTITPSYYRSAMGIILVYSADDKESFNSITVWMKHIKNFTDQKIPIILVCNKSDLINKQVSEKESEALAEYHNLQLIKASAKANKNINKIFERLFLRVTQSPISKDLLIQNSSISIKIQGRTSDNRSQTRRKYCYFC